MKSERLDGYWLASGNGPLRKIVAEGTTRRHAFQGYAECFSKQQQERRERIRAV